MTDVLSIYRIFISSSAVVRTSNTETAALQYYHLGEKLQKCNKNSPSLTPWCSSAPGPRATTYPENSCPGVTGGSV